MKGITLARPVAKVIEDEAERNPEFARRIRAAIAEAAENYARRRRAPPVLDPVDVAKECGKDGLRERLANLEIEQLRDIVSHKGMGIDAMRWKTRERVIDRIVDLSDRRARKGDAFRIPPTEAGVTATGAENIAE